MHIGNGNDAWPPRTVMTNGAPSGLVSVRRPEDQANVGEINVGHRERVTSVIVGAAMTLYGVRKMSPGGLALILSGGALIYRGMTGRSIIYEQLEIDRSTMR